MSFAKGFGAGFVPTFQRGIERKEQRRDDAFKRYYEDYKEGIKKRTEYESQDRKDVAKAKALAASAKREGAPLPENAWVNAYQWIKADLDEGTIMENLQTGQFEAPAPAETGPSEQPAGATGDVTAQTQAALAGPEGTTQPTAPATPTSPKGPKKGNVVTENFGLGKFFRGADKGGLFTTRESINQGAKEELANTLGVSPEDIDAAIQAQPEPGIDTTAAPTFRAGDPEIEISSLQQSILDYQLAEEGSTAKELAAEEITAHRSRLAIESAFRQKEQGQDISKSLVKYKTTDPETGREYWTTGQVVAEATPEGETVYKDIDGNIVEKPMVVLDAELDRLEKLRELSGSKESEEYRNLAAALPSLYREGGGMYKLATENPELMATWTTGAVQLGHRLITEGTAIGGILGGMNPSEIAAKAARGEPISDQEYQALQQAEQFLESDVDENIKQIMGDKAYDIGAAKVLWDTKAALMAYKMGVTQGQEGRALQEAEREMFMRLVQSGSSPEKFKENLGGFIRGTHDQLKDKEVTLNELNEDVKAFKEDFNWTPEFAQVPKIDKILKTRAEEDPNLAYGLEVFGKDDKGGVRDDMTRKETKTSTPSGIPSGSKPIGKTQDGRTVYETPDGKQIVE